MWLRGSSRASSHLEDLGRLHGVELVISWKMEVLVAQSCPTLWDPMDCGLPGSSVHGILQARILAWVAISSSRGHSWLRDWNWVSCIAGRKLTSTPELTSNEALGERNSFFESWFLYVWDGDGAFRQACHCLSLHKSEALKGSTAVSWPQHHGHHGLT